MNPIIQAFNYYQDNYYVGYCWLVLSLTIFAPAATVIYFHFKYKSK